jgi:hypothetical protein
MKNSFFNPYSLQRHAQQAVPSAHQTMPHGGPAHAPPLSRLPANPSAINPKNIVRGTYAKPIFKGL